MLLRFKFEKKDSLMHKLDPRAKLLLAIALMSFAFTEKIYIQLIVFAMIVIISALGRVSRAFIKIAISSMPVFLLIFILNYLYSGLEYAMEISLRFLNLISISSAIFLTTMPDELGLALDACRLPQRFSFILVSAARFIHTISREAEEISQAYIARGGVAGEGIVDRFRSFKAILIPLIAISIRRSLTMAEALEMRAFGAAKKTSLRELKMGFKDIVVILISLALLIIRIFGGGTRI